MDSIAVQKRALHIMIDALPSLGAVMKSALNDLSHYFYTADDDQRRQLIEAGLLQAQQELHGKRRES